MRIIIIVLFIFVCIQPIAAMPQIKPLSKYSNSPVLLEMADLPAGATVSYYVSHVNENKLTVWEPISTFTDDESGKMYYKAKHGETIRFRPSVQFEDSSSVTRIADFERPGSYLVFGFESSAQVFRCSYSVLTDSPPQGDHSLFLKVTRHDNAEIKEDDVFGFLFTDRIPTRDWSRFKFIEFFYTSDLPETPKLIIQGKGELHEHSLSEFYLNNDHDDEWKSVKVDLDQIFDTTEERSVIKVFAITHPVNSTELNRTYLVKFDAVRLWRDDKFVETTIDTTPSSVPTIHSSKIEAGRIHWSWDPAVDEESGVKGYAYSWSKSSRDNPPNEIMSTEPKVSFSFVYPPTLTTYHLKVKACNNAGVWSDVALESTRFSPKDDL